MSDRFRRASWAAGAPLRLALIGLIRLYRVTLGGVVGGGCRFYPSCSHYAEQAIARCGAVRGLGLTAWRIARCSPLTKGGVDYPPDGRRGLAAGYDGIIRNRLGVDSPKQAPA